MLWLYSRALFFSPIFSILLDKQPKFLFTKLSVLIVSYISKFVTSLPTGTTSLLTEHSRSVVSPTMRNESQVSDLAKAQGGTCTEQAEP